MSELKRPDLDLIEATTRWRADFGIGTDASYVYWLIAYARELESIVRPLIVDQGRNSVWYDSDGYCTACEADFGPARGETPRLVGEHAPTCPVRRGRELLAP